MESNNTPHWYVVQTFSGYENAVKESLTNMLENNSDLQDLIFDVVVPTEEDIVEKNGKKKVILRKKFPSYVFIKMIYTKNVWYMVTQTRGVTSFVGPGGRPLPLTEEEVKRNRLEAMELSDFKMEVGDQVKVLSGPLESFIGSIEDINVDKQKVKVIVSMFGRETPVELDFVQVEKL